MALNFNGASRYVNAGQDASITDIGDERTFICWFKFDSTIDYSNGPKPFSMSFHFQKKTRQQY